MVRYYYFFFCRVLIKHWSTAEHIFLPAGCSVPGHRAYRLPPEAGIAADAALSEVPGKVLTDDKQIKDRWKENYEELYNQPNPEDTSILEILPNNQPS